ncbi:hypothetical protein NIES37_63940 [Tolypothrix tenuis PCC 7101]|uniref:DUF4112 domain-containing protein n=1 Tax=Tolypothrix tenuis PCC 7101 TaxID=231146 RepID=A0A1Z4N9N8_9CYAN|nr:DUF4112 domain-containing protein [Aulosira sp. FACHB-113]BAZ02382.1 hypothetical protein NIES37_63940 [Tolypothrix tenuis PCC 7101]BAZ73697.1 hypothetical protein NIES50_22630 [Aulosira laxa NIES-50]
MDINRHFRQSLPLKVEAHEENLLQARNEIQKFIKLSEGLVFGKLGLDAAIGLLPIVDGLYTGIASFWLLLQSYRIKTDFPEKLLIIILSFADILLGSFPGAGDIGDTFFRVHAWNGNRLITHIDKQIALINRVREQLNQGLNPDISALEDILFRNGKTHR